MQLQCVLRCLSPLRLYFPYPLRHVFCGRLLHTCNTASWGSVCCSVLQCIALCCGVFCNVCCRVFPHWCVCFPYRLRPVVCDRLLHTRNTANCGSVCCRGLQCVAVCCSVLQCVFKCLFSWCLYLLYLLRPVFYYRSLHARNTQMYTCTQGNAPDTTRVKLRVRTHTRTHTHTYTHTYTHTHTHTRTHIHTNIHTHTHTHIHTHATGQFKRCD